MKKKQLGLTLTGFIFVAIGVVLILILGFKLFNPYSQYFAVKKTFKIMANSPEVRSGSHRDAMAVWARYAVVDNITAVDGDDITVTKEGGQVIVSAAYSVKVPLFYNYSLLIDFHPTSVESN